jgi:hypothetical protein
MTKIGFLFLFAFSSVNCFAFVGASPGDSGSIYGGLGGVSNNYQLQDFVFGTKNSAAGDNMIFTTEHSGIIPELHFGYVIPTAAESDNFRNFRFEVKAAFGSSNVESNEFGSAIFIPAINGSLPSVSTGNGTSVLRTDIDIRDIDILLKADIATDFMDMIITPIIGVNILSFDQTYTYSLSQQFGAVSSALVESLQTNYYGMKVGVMLTLPMSEFFSFYFGGTASYLQANTDFTGRQTITYSGITPYSFTVAQTDNQTSTRTQIRLGASLNSEFGQITILASIENLSYVPYINNPTSTQQNITTQARLTTDTLSATSIGAYYTYSYSLQ